MPDLHNSVEKFISELRILLREELGCGCSEEIFEQVRILKGEATPGSTHLGIIVGERLFVGFVDINELRPPEHNIPRLILSGVTYRDALKLNRIRFVVEGKPTDGERNLLESEASKHQNVHIHYRE